MCGIAGAVDTVTGRARERVSILNSLQGHRGPDHQTVTRVGVFTLGNTRLAVQDPTPAGNQPFVSDDGRYHCVFNGEIYNYRRLISQYQLQVHTGCDGEIIPELWAKLGPECLAEFRGMFAIALVDTLDEVLYLARDSFGIKPLYWRVLSDNSIIFASEVAPLASVHTKPQIDPSAICRYLNFGALASDQAPFSDMKALPPNSFATIDKNKTVTLRTILADGPLAIASSSPDLGSALTDSIELHLGADVPTALLLSAGVDSATIAAVGRRLGREVHCLTVATPGTADESQEAARTAQHYGHSFQRIPARLEDDDIARFFAAMQRPSIDGLNTYLVSKAVHEAGFKVALSGLGGDEAVGGYSNFRMLKYMWALDLLDKLPSSFARIFADRLGRSGTARKAKLTRLLDRGGPRDGRALCLLQREVLPASLSAELAGRGYGAEEDLPAVRDRHVARSFEVMAAAEVDVYLKAMLLPDADSFSMTSSVELRVPFVDKEVFSASIGLAARKKATPGKAAVGEALADPYIRNLARRPKRGFSLPMRHWMTGPLGPLAPVLDAANDPAAMVWSHVDRTVAERAGLIPLCARDRWAETWTLAALNAWLNSIGPVLAT
jgi:asparagine synthase (glutamine-hydrolysing)